MELNATFLGGAALIYGFNNSATRPSISGAGLEESHALEEVRIFGDSYEDASVHSVDRFRSAFELLLAHRSRSGSTAIISVLGEMRPVTGVCVFDASTKASLDPMTEALKEDSEKREPRSFEAFKPSSLLPSKTRLYYSYNGTVVGSCGERARYFILKEPIKLPRERVSRKNRIYLRQ
ncbi:carbonic anhydrase 2-like protein [Aphelenchoides avenae]|nr:carbonic anhydrase 2-like protein [Aphelenchus avenae]